MRHKSSLCFSDWYKCGSSGQPLKDYAILIKIFQGLGSSPQLLVKGVTIMFGNVYNFKTEFVPLRFLATLSTRLKSSKISFPCIATRTLWSNHAFHFEFSDGSMKGIFSTSLIIFVNPLWSLSSLMSLWNCSLQSWSGIPGSSGTGISSSVRFNIIFVVVLISPYERTELMLLLQEFPLIWLFTSASKVYFFLE